jgi:hypothetical protein
MERAFVLAKSGQCESITRLKECLADEGYSEWQLRQFSMPALGQQLRRIIFSSRHRLVYCGPPLRLGGGNKIPD